MKKEMIKKIKKLRTVVQHKKKERIVYKEMKKTKLTLI